MKRNWSLIQNRCPCIVYCGSKEIYKNISGLRNYEHTAEIAQHIIEQGNYKNLAKTDMLMISRSQTIMQSYPQARA